MTYLLHISDLHLVVNPLWNNMKNAILYSVRQKLQMIPQGQKLLVITGDFHNFIENNFDQAKLFLPQLFEAMDIDPTKDVFVIPGNHDISKNAASDDSRKDCITSIQEYPDRLHGRVDKLLSYYDNYLEFVKAIHIYPTDDDPLFPARVHVRNWRNQLNILHLNTTLIADGSSKTEQMTDTLTATSDEIKELLEKNHLPCIAIGHNSFFDLRKEQREALSGMFLHTNISAYLCGDRHLRNTKREENEIRLTNEISTVRIPNIVSYRSSVDENDAYSDFGMIWHIWDETSGKVKLEFQYWDPHDQGILKPDGEDEYSFRYLPQYTVHTHHPWSTNYELKQKSNVAIKESHIRNFLLGYRHNCNLWGLAFSDRIVHRKIIDELYDYATEGGTYALTGPGGEGKSTILMQLCAKLVQNEIPVFYYHGHDVPKLPEIVPDTAVFILDNPPDTFKFKKFLYDTIDKGHTLILGMRKNEWNLLKETLGISNSDVYDISIQTLTTEEAENFADCICNNLSHSKSRNEIKKIFLNNSYGFLYAAMLLAVSDKNSLKDIAHQIVKKLSNRSRSSLLLLACIVLSERFEVKFTHGLFKQVCERLKLTPREANLALSREIINNGNRYQTRHEIISKLFYHELFSNNGFLLASEMYDALTDLFEYYLLHYSSFSGRAQFDSWNSIMRLCGGLAQTDLKTQQYIIDRILDEIKQKKPKSFNQLPSHFDDEELVLLFYRRCFDRALFSSEFLQSWCGLLLKNQVFGTVYEDYSPAWIYKEACINHNADSNAWLAWAQLEAQENGAGDYETEFTARWIFKNACINHNADSIMWKAWAQLEARQNNIGDYISMNTARWIFKDACINHNADSNTWLAWAQLEAQENGAGDYKTEYTARWIFKDACINHNADGQVWLAWAQLEVQENDIGNYETEYTARWIFFESIKRYPDCAPLYSSYASLELSQSYATRAREILRNSLQYSDFCIGKLAILEYFYGNIRSDDEFCVNQLLKRMEKAVANHSFSAILCLYHIFSLTGKVEDAQRYYELLLHHPQYDPANTYFESFIQLCREAIVLEV